MFSLFTAIVLLVVAVLLIELINTSLSGGSLLCASVERVALGADFDVDLRLCGTGNECVAAVACHSCLIILGLNRSFHNFPPYLSTRAVGHRSNGALYDFFAFFLYCYQNSSQIISWRNTTCKLYFALKSKFCLVKPLFPISEYGCAACREEDGPHGTAEHLSPSGSPGRKHRQVAGAVKQIRNFKTPCEFIAQREYDPHDRSVQALRGSSVRDRSEEHTSEL